jgi:group I intron endonuclease
MPDVYIYGLVDPRNQQIRYVGRTINLHKRLNAHINGREPHSEHKQRWIDQIKSDGSIPEIVTLETSTEDGWKEAERFWISYFRYIGANLTNISNGGQGIGGKRFSEEDKMRMSVTRKGKKRSPEACANISKGRIGIKHTEETKKKISDIVKKSWSEHPEIYEQSADARTRTSVAMATRVVSEETRRRMSIALTGHASRKLTDEEKARASKSTRIYWEKVHSGEIIR